MHVGYHILVYLQGHFLHCINTRQQEMLCHSLFLSGKTNPVLAERWPFVYLLTQRQYMLLFCPEMYFFFSNRTCTNRALIAVCSQKLSYSPICPFQQPQGVDVDMGLRCQSANIAVLYAEEESSGGLLDSANGRIYTAELNPSFLLQILRSDTPSR